MQWFWCMISSLPAPFFCVPEICKTATLGTNVIPHFLNCVKIEMIRKKLYRLKLYSYLHGLRQGSKHRQGSTKDQQEEGSLISETMKPEMQADTPFEFAI